MIPTPYGYHNITSEEVNMNEDNEEKPGVFEKIDYFDVFNTSQVLI